MSKEKDLTEDQRDVLLKSLQTRFNDNMNRHEGFNWSQIEKKLLKNPDKLWSLNEMEKTGGEPDVINLENNSNEYVFCDFSKESPKGRRSVCYDREAQDSRKKFKPENNAAEMAANMGIELLTEEQYRNLQKFGNFDTKTSSWLQTPDDIRKLGGAIFADFRYGKVFIYHNGAESYYAARGFRGLLKV